MFYPCIVKLELSPTSEVPDQPIPDSKQDQLCPAPKDTRRGVTMFSARHGRLENLISKRKDSPYRSGRSPDWLKMKNPACEAVRREAEEDWGTLRILASL